MIQNKRVNWESCQIGIPGATTKDKENRRIPFNPKGRVAAILERRAALGSDAFVFGSANGAYQPNIQTAWETLRLLANGIEPKPGKEGAQWNREQIRANRPPLARLASRGRVSIARGRRRHPHHSVDARPCEHSANATLLERDGRRTQERIGSELEQQRPTASPRIGKLIDLVSSTDCPRFVPGNLKTWLRGPATAGTCNCGMSQPSGIDPFMLAGAGRYPQPSRSPDLCQSQPGHCTCFEFPGAKRRRDSLLRVRVRRDSIDGR